MATKLHTKNITPKAFTTRDLLITQAVFAILLLITFLIINPAKKLNEATTQKKTRDIVALENSLKSYAKDNGGQFPKNVPSQGFVAIKKNEGREGDICNALVPKYIPELPTNPSLSITPVKDCSKDYVTGYFLKITTPGEIEVSSE